MPSLFKIYRLAIFEEGSSFIAMVPLYQLCDLIIILQSYFQKSYFKGISSILTLHCSITSTSHESDYIHVFEISKTYAFKI